ncbi:hypothetical protein [Thalassospira alkalitolerans]|uniref:hypothetical protein n=1 Tax=Thalassospira alkalitolerans TaxID=1293890 RepID=UPI003AA89541
MFGHPSLNNTTPGQTSQGRAADLLATSRRLNLSDNQSNARQSGTNQDRTTPDQADIRGGRRIIDQIDESLKINLRIDEALRDATLPTATASASPLDTLIGATGATLDDAATKMNRDAFIVLAMLGIPPAEAREMADALTSGLSGDMTAGAGVGGSPAALARDFGLSLANGLAQRGSNTAFSMVSQTIQIDMTQIEARFASASGNGKISISEFNARIEQIRVEIINITQQDPLILDLDGNGIDITSLENGKVFDINGDGADDKTAWITGNDALLALDRNGDGTINDGTELFGDQNGAKDGFAELAKYDANNDGRIDNQDDVFSSLVLLRADGSTGSLEDAGITAIDLTFITPLDQKLVGGVQVASARFERDNGNIGTVGEVLFDVRA